MARINIEDSIYKDQRWFELLLATGSPDTALGALVRAFSHAQGFWFPEKNGIPLDEWKKQKLNDKIIEVGFAEIKGNEVFVSGSEEQFSWLFMKSENGKKGGRPKKESYRNLQLSTESYRKLPKASSSSSISISNTKEGGAEPPSIFFKIEKEKQLKEKADFEAGRLIQALGKFRTEDRQAAIEWLGPDLAYVVELNSGWSHLKRENIDSKIIPTWRNQLLEIWRRNAEP